MTETNDGPSNGGREQPGGRAGRRHRLEGTDRDEYWQSFFSELPKQTSSKSRHYAALDDDDPVDEERPDEQSTNTGGEGATTSARAPHPPAAPPPAPTRPPVPAAPTVEPAGWERVAQPDDQQSDGRHETARQETANPYRRTESARWVSPDARAMPQSIAPTAPSPRPPASGSGDGTGRYATTGAGQTLRGQTDVIDYAAADETVVARTADQDLGAADTDHGDLAVDDRWSAAPEDYDEPVTPLLAGGRRRPVSEERRRRRRMAGAAAVVVLLVLIGGVGYAGLKMAGVFDSDANYSSTTGDADVLVQIPDGVSVRGAGAILKDSDVVASQKAFANAVSGGTITPGFYKLRTRISAARAYQLLQQQDSEVGVVAVAPGLQLLDTKDSQGQDVPGIFSRIESATAVTINGRKLGVSVADLENVAANDSAADLGVPSWAASQVDGRKGDARRIEGLIVAAQQDYSVDPTKDAREILSGLITDSAAKLDAWGINDYANSGLPSQYSVLVSASIAEKEVSVQDPAQAQTYRAQVTRVIVNRLKKPQRLEMDSTINYTRAVRNLSLSNQDSVANTPWNTYMIDGLPPTPIGAVGKPELTAALNPSPGDWLYFVTVDNNGTTLFTADYNTQIANQRTACHNGLIHCPEP